MSTEKVALQEAFIAYAKAFVEVPLNELTEAHAETLEAHVKEFLEKGFKS